jgi:hypothetical protein
MDIELTSALRQVVAQVNYKESDVARRASRRQAVYPEEFRDDLDTIKEIKIQGYAFLLPVLI